MEIFLLRHGKTAGNLAGRYNGRTDEPLCAEGVAEAKRLGAVAALPLVLVSPLRRARQTAALLFPNAAQRVVAGFGEMDFGVFEGRSAAEMENDPVYRAWVEGGCLGQCPGGDDLDAFIRRASGAFEAEADRALEEGHRRLAIVAHGGTCAAVMHRFAGEERGYFGWMPKNLQGWYARLTPEEWRKNRRFDAWEALEDLRRMEA